MYFPVFDNNNYKIIIIMINFPVLFGCKTQSLLVLLRNSVAHDANLMLVMLVMMVMMVMVVMMVMMLVMMVMMLVMMMVMMLVMMMLI